MGTNFALPRFGPKVLVPVGMTLVAVAMLLFTRLGLDSTYAADVLPPLMLMGFGMGTVMPASIQTATLGVEPAFAGVASALANTSQQVGGSIGTAVLNTIATTAATAYVSTTLPVTDLVLAQAAVQSYAAAYWWCAGLFAAGAVLAAALFRRRPAGEQVPNPAREPVIAA